MLAQEVRDTGLIEIPLYVLLTRLLSVYRGWETPVAHDFTYVMRRPIDRLRRRRLDDVNITSDEQRGGAS